jgi:hypothetical protein
MTGAVVVITVAELARNRLRFMTYVSLLSAKPLTEEPSASESKRGADG